MINEFVKTQPASQASAETRSQPDAVWIDLFHPTKDEEAQIEAAFGIDVPTREEVQEIELSSRLYTEEDAIFMTANILSHTEGDDAVISPLTLILVKDRLITVRYEDPRSISNFAVRCGRAGAQSANIVAIGLLEAIVERLADLLERLGHDLDTLSAGVFQPPKNEAPTDKKGRPKPRKTRATRDFQAVLVRIGNKGDLLSKVRESLISIQRVATFLAASGVAGAHEKEFRARLKSLSRDVEALTDHAGFINQKNNFLLDATLGMINIEQNAIIKIFSVAAVVFLPPTLIASIYGMNFDFMPELSWPFGYPFAIGLMIISAILPFYFFKGRGWL
jgi:magnesium transporter